MLLYLCSYYVLILCFAFASFLFVLRSFEHSRMENCNFKFNAPSHLLHLTPCSFSVFICVNRSAFRVSEEREERRVFVVDGDDDWKKKWVTKWWKQNWKRNKTHYNIYIHKDKSNNICAKIVLWRFICNYTDGRCRSTKARPGSRHERGCAWIGRDMWLMPRQFGWRLNDYNVWDLVKLDDWSLRK